MNIQAELYKKMYLIRTCESKIQEHYSDNEMKTPMHMSAGSEAIAAGVCLSLRQEDQVLSTYRSHACYLAKTGDSDAFFTEMYGKVLGGGRGKSGSMHLSKPECGHIMSSAIVASHIPVASGIAFANKMHGNDKVCTVFFGDGALDEGVFWETLNAACLMQLPILFVCEDNGFAVHSVKSQRQGYKNIDDVVSQFNCSVYSLDPNVATDAEIVYTIVQKSVNSTRTDHKPSFVRIPYYRYLEHVGINEDFHRGYRPKSEFDEWRERDPLKIMRERLDRTEAEKIEREIDAQISHSIALAKNAEFADISELYKDVFYE